MRKMRTAKLIQTAWDVSGRFCRFGLAQDRESLLHTATKRDVVPVICVLTNLIAGRDKHGESGTHLCSRWK